MSETFGENMVNYHASALVELLRKKMADKLQTIENLKKEYKSYCEFLSFQSDSEEMNGDKNSNIECDWQVFLGALNYVVEKLTQLKENSANKRDDSGKCSSSLSSSKRNTKEKCPTETKEKDDRMKDETEQNSWNAKFGKGEDVNQQKIRKLQSEIEEYTVSITTLKNRNRILLEDMNSLEKKYTEERKRRKSIESRCESAKCQSVDYQNLKDENFFLKHKNKVLQEENEMLKDQNGKNSLFEQMQAKIKTQRISLASLNQAYKKLLDKAFSYESSPNDKTLGINCKRWLNDKYDDKSATAVKRQRPNNIDVDLGMDQTKTETKPKQIKSLLEIDQSRISSVTIDPQNEIINKSNKIKNVRVPDTNASIASFGEDDIKRRKEILVKPKIKSFVDTDALSVENNMTNVDQVVKKEERIRSPFESKENLVDRKTMLPKVKIEKEFDEIVSGEKNTHSHGNVN